MKHLIILCDGMSDHPVASLGGLTPLAYAHTPAMDSIARRGRSGLLTTVPEGFAPGSEVANASILGYDVKSVYEGRGVLEAASIGYDMAPTDMAMRCNILTLSDDGLIQNHHGGHLTTEQGTALIEYLQERLGDDRVRFIPGVQYRHLLVVKGGSKYVETIPPHDHPGERWRDCLVRPVAGAPEEPGRLTPEETADLLNSLILRSQELLKDHPFNQGRTVAANSIWPWSPGYRPAMSPLGHLYPDLRDGKVITAVDLIRGLGIYAGLQAIDVDGATGLADTNYEGKASAALKALRDGADFVFLHIEACDEAGHDGDLDLKLKSIERIDSRVIGPILEETGKWDEPVAIAVLPDHATPVEERVHRSEPVPFAIYYPGIIPDGVASYSEASARLGDYGLLGPTQFMNLFMNIR
ncbi:MAG: cofactor-independent phosphoglycerate mutase [Muribaculaceae bacterium]|nr:cofactor-independent phosphoglycerate mutase [Muribaculaceae bacterium]